MEGLLALLLTFVVMWALLIRPQQRRMRQHQAVVSSLEPGDLVVTAGGIYGTVLSVEGDEMMLEVAPDIELRVLRGAVTQRVSRGDDADDDNADDSDDDLDDDLDADDREGRADIDG